VLYRKRNHTVVTCVSYCVEVLKFSKVLGEDAASFLCPEEGRSSFLRKVGNFYGFDSVTTRRFQDECGQPLEL
jgi:predicted RNA-binding Zn-ribbon protein involved in translation (DUF1610 family)